MQAIRHGSGKARGPPARRAGATEAEARAMAGRIVRSKSPGAIGGRIKPAPLAIPVRALARRRGKEAPPFRPEEARRGADGLPCPDPRVRRESPPAMEAPRAAAREALTGPASRTRALPRVDNRS